MNIKTMTAIAAAALIGGAIPAAAQTAPARQAPPLTSQADGTGVSTGHNYPGRANAGAERYRDATQSTPKHFGGISKGQNAAKRKTDTNNGK